MTPCRYYAILERHTRLLYNAWSEASGLVSRHVSLWSSVSVSVFVLQFGRCFVLFGPVDADAPLQRKVLVDNGGV